MSSLGSSVGLDTSLRLGVGGGGGRGSGCTLLGQVDEHELLPPPAPQGWEAAAQSSSSRNEGSATDGTVTTSWRNKKGRKIRGGDGDRRSLQSDGGDSGGGGGARKKLRLTGEQAALLEASFRAHSILSHGEKHDLARQVGLRPRQVEVWFQNRRARTKLKQTELDRELLRRWREQLTGENARLRREIADLRSSSAASRLAAMVACPCCSKLPSAGGRLSPADRGVVIAAVPSEVRRLVRCSRGLQFRRPATVS